MDLDEGARIQLVGLSFPVTHIQLGQREQQSRIHVTFSPFPASPRIPRCPRKQPSFLTLRALCISKLTPSRSPFGCFFSTSPSPALSLPIVSNYNTHQNFFQAALSSSQYLLKLTGDECDLYLTRLASHSRHVGTTQECQRIMYNTKLDKCKDRFK